MKKILFVVLLLWCGFHLRAQPISKAEALTFADKLYSVEILSEQGRDTLKQRITDNRLDGYKKRSFINKGGNTNKALSKGQLLYFLAEAFGSEVYYRMGLTIHMQALQVAMQEDSLFLMNPEAQQRLADSLQNEWVKSDVYQAEEDIKNEDMVAMGTPGTSWHGAFPDDSFPFPQRVGHGLIHVKRSTTGKQCARTLTDLLKIQLIDSNIYRQVLPQIKEGNLPLEVYILMAATERCLFYENFDDNKKKEMDLLNGLVKADVLKPDALKRLLATYKEKEIKVRFEYVPYSHLAKVFAISKLDPDPVKTYKQIFDSIGMLVPGLHVRNLKVAVNNAEAWDSELTERNATISFDADGQHYAHSFFYDFLRKPTDPKFVPDTVFKITPGFHGGVNKWLADQDSPLRLYYISMVDEQFVYSKNEFGLILMTKAQADAWGADGYYLTPENHDNSFNTKNIAKALALYEQIGLFKQLSKQVIAEGKEKVRTQDIPAWQSVLACFPNTLVEIDWEAANLENPYEEFAQELQAASRGAFTITDIRDEFKNSEQKETTLFSFSMNGKTYSKQLKMEGDWLDPAFFEMIEQAIKENNIKGKFYLILSDGQVSGYLFLTPEQYKVLVKEQASLFAVE